jgi:hypothetical protein
LSFASDFFAITNNTNNELLKTPDMDTAGLTDSITDAKCGSIERDIG